MGPVKFAKRRGLAVEIIAAVALMIAVGMFFVVAGPLVNMFLSTIQLNFGQFLDPNIANTFKSEIALAAVAIIVSLAIFIILAGMRRQPGEEFG